MLPELERYYDAAPRSAARVEQVGPFSVFVGTGSWSYYARPRLGLEHAFTIADVEAATARKRELGQPENIEWVHETTPTLLDAVRAAGLEVLEAPLLVLDRSAWRAPEPPSGMTLRVLDADDPALAAASAVQAVGFGAPGTAPGPEGVRERDAAIDDADSAFLRERMRRGLTVTVVAESEYGPVAAGAHQPVDGVSEIVGVATLPAVRRQGLGGAVTGALVEDALARGVETVFISAGSDDIARVYARLGFRRVGTACIVG
ncbi:GNAT family N-acetyltransferase [Solirubrobacter ginsenosidimutans]|uniref:GNAT family N-acetyltransferase n=1 Tax=Solirubrobacter ginsenosidimutans TaxID=490573 RepID=A0A9X3MZC0_9ACTN|nr:GNAT family N-acetyltransferase [Solirubrobacter ginsenosidimutans]MDA0165544.1 GNAT family N-acetyltransferase [Solirubrobacter ginsenosidimutans]